MVPTACEACSHPFGKRERRHWIGLKPYCFTCRPLPEDEPAAISFFSEGGRSPSGSSAEERRNVRILQQCGEGNVRAKITYQKSGEESVTERIIEPYSFGFSYSGLIVFTWQCSPALDEPSWRSFRVERIKAVEPLSESFRARVPVTLHTREPEAFRMASPEGSGDDAARAQQRYAGALTAALDDFEITAEEAAALRALRAPLDPEQIRAIHGRSYAQVLADICADGRVTDDEMEKLAAMRIWLTELGWSP